MKSSTVIPICKCCSKPIETNTIGASFFGAKTICFSCFRSFMPRFLKWKEGDVPCLSLYVDDQGIRSALFQFKGCFDYELKDVFLERLLPVFRWKYRGYLIVPAPSYCDHDLIRGFNHVEEMFSPLGLPIVKAIRKTKDVKQADLDAEGRSHIGSYLTWGEKTNINGKKVLFVDDVFTTGSTARACLALIKSHKPKKIKALFLSKVKPKTGF